MIQTKMRNVSIKKKKIMQGQRYIMPSDKTCDNIHISVDKDDSVVKLSWQSFH